MTPPVLIAGAGIGGLALALTLHEIGVRCLLEGRGGPGHGETQCFHADPRSRHGYDYWILNRAHDLHGHHADGHCA